MSTRWVMLAVAETEMDRLIFRGDTCVKAEAPRGMGREVRLATLQETGLFTRLALPAPR